MNLFEGILRSPWSNSRVGSIFVCRDSRTVFEVQDGSKGGHTEDGRLDDASLGSNDFFKTRRRVGSGCVVKAVKGHYSWFL
jgi:hypothetical protein